MDLLSVSNVSKHYKEFDLTDVSFTLPQGYIMGYVGRNGAGKTTTINCITHLCHPDQGTITINGLSYKDDPIGYKECIGFIGDESYFPKEMKLKDIRTIQRKFYPTFDSRKFDELTQHFGLPSSKKIQDFSRGMKVKLMFAAALSRETKLLVLDEATNGLDPVMRSEILELLQSYIADGNKSILFSTHMLEDLEQISDYIIFIDNGRLLLHRPKDELLEDYVLVKGNESLLSDDLRQKMIGITSKSYSFEALLPSEAATGLPLDFVVERPTIDQIMIHIIRQQEHC